MKLELIQAEELLPRLASGEARLIDVRAPVEFLAGSIPGSVNLPILNDEERARVGTVYKQKGSEHAIALGHELVSGDSKRARIDAWCSAIASSKIPVYFTCFRGGMRSRLAQEWTAQAGQPVPRLDGGYKKFRRLLMEQIEKFDREMIVLTGKTGAGKTSLLREMRKPWIDLEAIAKHRGSAFGAYDEPQPTQIDFENRLALELTRAPREKIWVEDESRMVGKNVLPESLFRKMRSSAVVVLDEPLEVRVDNTLKEYVIDRAQHPKLFSRLHEDLEKIKKRLGGLRYQEVFDDLRRAHFKFRESGDFESSKAWIEKLLVWYYDPLYEASFARRKLKELQRGDRKSILGSIS